MIGEIKDVQIPSTSPVRSGSSKKQGPFRYPAYSNFSLFHVTQKIRNFISGAKGCYDQLLGQTDGCFLKDLKYDATCGIGNYIPKIKSWGACAAECKSTSGCLSWTWASNACTNCVPEDCNLFTGFEDCPNQLPKQVVAPGHISGDASCEDIRYIETEDLSKVIPVLGADHRQWGEGSCKGFDGREPTCPGQEVPGFRSQHYILH